MEEFFAMKSLRFRIRFAFKNIITNPGRSFVILFTLFLSMMVFVVVFNIHNAFTQYYYYRSQEQYMNIDLTITYDSNSEARIINQRHLLEDYSEYYDSIACFFNYYSLTASADDSENPFYTHVLSSSVAELESVIDVELNSLPDHQALITHSLSKSKGLAVGDELSIYVSEQKVTYTVGGIVEDRGVFKDDAIFVDKVELLYELYGLTPLRNLGNIIYLDLKEEVSVDEFITLMQTDSEYQNYVTSVTINPELINQSATQVSAMFIGVSFITLVALVLILNSIFPLLFHDFRAQVGIIRTLGGDHRFSFSVWIYQFVMFFLVSIPLGVLTAWLLLNKGMELSGIRSTISLGTWQVPVAILGFVLIIGLEVVIRYFQLSKKSVVSLSTDRRSERTSPSSIFLLLTGLALLLSVIIKTGDEKILSAIRFILALLFSFNFLGVAMRQCGRWFSKAKKRSLFTLFGSKNLESNLILHNSLRVAMVSAIIIVLTISIRSFMVGEIKNNGEAIQADYFLTNIVDYEEALKEDISQEPGVESIDKSITYTNVIMTYSDDDNSTTRKISYLVSLPYDKYPLYFGFEISGDVEEKFSDTSTAYIVLPVTVAKTLGIEIGDQVSINVSRSIPELSFTVAGFVISNYTGFSFTNLCSLSAFDAEDNYNTLMINTTAEESNPFKLGLMKAYNARMYYVIDTDELIDDIGEEMLSLTNYLSFLAYAIAFAFLIVILNNSLLVFYHLRPIYAKMKVLGTSTTELICEILLELLVMVLILFISSSVCLLSLFPNLGPLMLFLHYYKMIHVSPVVILGRTLLGSAVFALSYVLLFIKVRSINLIQEIKQN